MDPHSARRPSARRSACMRRRTASRCVRASPTSSIRTRRKRSSTRIRAPSCRSRRSPSS
jgi:hypothetical protein